MDLLEFARGPALQWAAYILVAGTIWRLVGIALLKEKPDFSEPRGGGGLPAALKVIWTRAFTAEPFKKATLYPKMMAYVMHIGLFAVIFLFTPHIVFFEGFLGFDWPGLPNNLILVVGGITLASSVALLVRRLTHPALKVISSADDYITWCVTTLPLVTGFLTFAHLGLRYETMLAIHILSFELLLIWFPFGKLMHTFFVFPSRYNVGATFARRGVKA